MFIYKHVWLEVAAANIPVQIQSPHASTFYHRSKD